MIMPNGAEVRFADVFRVDKRKWDNKGLAYVYHRSGGAGKRAVVDDLKYDGAGRVLDRLLAQFNGELIEKVQDVNEDETPSQALSMRLSPKKRPMMIRVRGLIRDPDRRDGFSRGRAGP